MVAEYVPMSADESLACARDTIHRIITALGDRDSLVTQISVEVGAEIVETVIQPGYHLNSVDLARRYQTSRTPIRDALMLLEKEGLVDIPSNRRPRAATMDISTIGEIYRTRAAILERVAVDVVENASTEDLDSLEEGLGKMEVAFRNKDINGYVWANIAFHDLNLIASGNRTAKRIVESLLLRTIHLRRGSLSREGRLAASVDDHQRLLKAYRDRDANLAAALVRSNHLHALRNIVQRLAG